jgi:hypothetical protein
LKAFLILYIPACEIPAITLRCIYCNRHSILVDKKSIFDVSVTYYNSIFNYNGTIEANPSSPGQKETMRKGIPPRRVEKRGNDPLPRHIRKDPTRMVSILAKLKGGKRRNEGYQVWFRLLNPLTRRVCPPRCSAML